MKTNHQRSFKAPDNGKHGRILRVLHGVGTKNLFVDDFIGGKYPGVGGDRENRHAIAGMKKFVRSRVRFHENAITQKLARESDADR